MLWILSVILSLYVFMVLAFIFIWHKKTSFFPGESLAGTRISVIIPARNEAGRILQLLQGLEKQTYPVGLFEVLVVDDNSEDKTQLVIRNFRRGSQIDLKLLKVKSFERLMGKKAAIQTGVSEATGSLIVTTDADCLVQPEWLSVTEAFYREKQLKMVVGPVVLKPVKSLFTEMQVIEFASLVGSGACVLQAGVPSMCNGANLAYEKSVFEEVGGFEGNENLASGDDEFLMHKVFKKYPEKVDFLKNSKAVVSTLALKSGEEFYQQRKRWASKWGSYKNSLTRFLAFFVFISNFATVLFYIAIPFAIDQNPLILLPFLLKIMVEFYFLKQVVEFGGKKFNVKAFLLLEFIYPAYVSFFGLVSSGGKYKWKGRELK